MKNTINLYINCHNNIFLDTQIKLFKKFIPIDYTLNINVITTKLAYNTYRFNSNEYNLYFDKKYYGLGTLKRLLDTSIEISKDGPAIFVEFDIVPIKPINIRNCINKEPSDLTALWPSLFMWDNKKNFNLDFITSNFKENPFNTQFEMLQQTYLKDVDHNYCECVNKYGFRIINDEFLHFHNRNAGSTISGFIQDRMDCWHNIINSITKLDTPTQTRKDLIKYIDGDERMTIKTTEKSEKDDTNDLRGLRHGRAKHEGFPIGQTINPAPMLFTRDGHNLWMADMYKGSSAFLILGGPSFGDLINEKEKIELYPKKFISNKDCLKYPGILTMSVNNTPKTFRTNLWTCVDDPSHFIKSIWLDPVIQKFVPLDHAEKFIFDNETWKTTEIKVGDCPNVVFYRRNEKFQAKQFLTESTFNWGDHSNLGGGRTVMLVAIRMLYYLGIRKIYLLGCDFSMSSESKYHFKQGRSKSSINGNNGTYAKLMKRFSDLKPILKEHNLEIYNCNHESRLRVFPFVNFREAWFDVIKHMPVNIKNERTDGLYDRMAKLKKDNK